MPLTTARVTRRFDNLSLRPRLHNVTKGCQASAAWSGVGEYRISNVSLYPFFLPSRALTVALVKEKLAQLELEHRTRMACPAKMANCKQGIRFSVV